MMVDERKYCPYCGEGYASHDAVKDAWAAADFIDRQSAAWDAAKADLNIAARALDAGREATAMEHLHMALSVLREADTPDETRTA